MNIISEEIERIALEDLHDIAPDDLKRQLDIQGLKIGGGFVSIAGALPTSAIVINRVIGMGLSTPIAKESVEEIIEAYKKSHVLRYFFQLHPKAQPKDIIAWLNQQGLEKARGWQKFSRGREALADTKGHWDIREISAKEGMDAALILSDAFDLGDASRPWLASLPNSERWHVFVAYDGSNPMATGSIFIDGEYAWTDFGATSPNYRQRGCQSALLTHRIQFALDKGCKQIFTCTGEDVPGDPQHSYSNILKAGFKETYIRENYALPKQ